MQAVLLAAGMATRLRPLTDSCPKCLLNVGGKAILERAIEAVLACGIDEFVFVTGYRAQMIESFVASRFPSLKAEWIRNERFAETNNAYSLLLSEPAVRGPFLLLDSDILFPPELLHALSACPERPCIALDRHPCSEEEMKIELDGSLRVADIGKELDPATAAGESIGFEIFSDEARRALYSTLRKRIVGEGRENEFYEASFKEMILGGVAFQAVDTTRYPAMEIDSVADLARARAEFAGAGSGSLGS